MDNLRSTLLLLLLAIPPLTALAQPTITQVVRGSILDRQNRLGLPGANVALYRDSTLVQGTVTDVDGLFRMDEVPVDRYKVVVRYIGYETVVVADVVVISGRQTVLDIEMEESIVRMDELVVSGQAHKGEALNEMTAVSARAFSVDESGRYAGSRGEPARMAANFAGVLGNNDNSNDIIVRGNSPLGLLWRLEDVNIPNPNHFAVAGTSGGPIMMLNNKVLANSDFLTGAFPAEYGNTVAGVFDLRMRNGNNEKHEFSGQIGFLGLEANAEGPLGTGRASYLASYRYSTLALFGFMGINIGTDAIPQYQDFAFKVNIPSGKKTNISWFGMGGMSTIDLLKSGQTDIDATDVFGEDKDEYFRSRSGVTGLRISHALSEKLLLKATLSYSAEVSTNNLWDVFRHVEDSLWVLDSIVSTAGYRFRQDKAGLALSLNHKAGLRHTLKYGLFADQYFFSFRDSIMNMQTWQFRTRLDHEGTGLLLQPYAQWRFRASEQVTLLAGLHGQYLSFSGAAVVEPRLGMRWQVSDKNTISLGLGRHSQMLPTYLYFSGNYDADPSTLPNQELGFIRSDHVVGGWDHYFSRNLRLKLEAYYQNLFDVPVTVQPSSYSVLNEGDDLNRFFPDSLANSGSGRNYGMELTLEKFFSKQWFMLATVSLFDSRYQASDGRWYNTTFNSNYVANLLAGREFTWGSKRNNTLGTGAKVTLAGGRRTTPIDTIATNLAGEVVYIDSLRNTEQFRDYFRIDVNITYKMNTQRLTHEFGLDLVNLTNRENPFRIRYNPVAEALVAEPQLGFLPIFFWRVVF